MCVRVFFGVSFKGTVANNDVRFTHHTHAPCLWLEESKKIREKKRYTQRKTELKNPFAMETMQWYFFFHFHKSIARYVYFLRRLHVVVFVGSLDSMLLLFIVRNAWRECHEWQNNTTHA